mgnify:CR=1 FL=1
MKRLASAILALLAAAPAAADVSVRFIEGAPKDRFVIASETGFCADAPITFTVDLAGSAGALIFDVTSDGAGVEVFQPFELTTGAGAVSGVTPVTDGDTSLAITVDSFPAMAEIAFTIDVDDTLGAREITVSNGEILGASLVVTSGDASYRGAFESGPMAVVDTPECAV